MSLPDEKKRQPSPMRRMAEATLARHPVTETAVRSAEDLLHELQVHQVDLEMQNEALRQAQSELEASRDSYVDLYDFAPVGYLTLNRNGVIEKLNLTAATLLGAERKKLLERRFTALVVSDDRNRWMQYFSTMMKQEGKGSVELALQRGDGTVFQAQLDCEPARVGARDTAIRIALTDITQRQRVEQSMREHEQQLQLFIEHSPVALAMFDREMRYLQVSRRWMEDYRLGDRDLSGLSHYEVFPEIPERWKDVHQRGIAGEVVRENQDRFERADGSIQWLFWEVRPWYNEANAIGGIIVFVEDITDRKQAKAELLATRNRLQATLDALPDLLFEVGLDGRIHDYHTHRSDLLAAPPDVFLGKTFTEVLPPEAAEVCLAAIVEAENKGWSIGGYFVLTLPQGEHWFELSVAPMAPTAGQDRRYVLLSRDVTERKRAEIRLAERESVLRIVMQEAHDRLAEFAVDQDRAIETERKRLARELHDELGQGLTALHLDIEWLSGKVAHVAPEIDERLDAMRQMIATTADAMRQICEDMRPGMLDDLGLEAALEDHAQRFFVNSGIPCNLSMDRSDYGLSDAASTALFRIFQEALTNIGRHAEASAVTATLEDSGDAVILRIADDGKGMPENEQTEGHFGLRGMRERTRLLNGTFAINSAQGQGTRIEVRIPRTTGARAS